MSALARMSDKTLKVSKTREQFLAEYIEQLESDIHHDRKALVSDFVSLQANCQVALDRLYTDRTPHQVLASSIPARIDNRIARLTQKLESLELAKKMKL